jgi:hypothetical protein
MVENYYRKIDGTKSRLRKDQTFRRRCFIPDYPMLLLLAVIEGVGI